MSEVQKTLKEKVIDYMSQKIQAGYKVDSKEAAIKLKKLAMQDMKIKLGNQAHVSDALKQTMEKLNLKFPDKVGDNMVQGIKAKIFKTETLAPTPEIPTGNGAPIPPLSEGQASPTGQSLEPINRVTPEMAQSYEHGMKHLFGGLMKFYAKTGLIEAEDVPHEDKPMKLADYVKETDNLAHDWSDYCLRHNIRLPKIFELAILVVSTIMVLGSPLFSTMLFGRKKQKVKKEGLGTAGDEKEFGTN